MKKTPFFDTIELYHTVILISMKGVFIMKLNLSTYKDKVKACWIGKNIGGTMGGPFEGKRELLDVKGFISKKGEPLPNDDLDLQLVWLHALENVGPNNINASILGEFWLSFIPPHWNEYGVGKANMRRGLIPPLAGDYDTTWRDSNGAWIRTEVWACSAPALPEVAAKFAIEDAKVDHGAGEGTFAAAFVAAMQSAAFVLENLEDCIEVGLAAIPAECRIAKSVKLVLDCYRGGKSWVEARNTVLETNMDIGNGWFEAPSNVAYTVIGLIYGEGDFKKSMLTAINCGDDTDCTAATVGATMGILYGTEKIPSDWAEYIGDAIVTISLAQGGVGRSFPKTCSELSWRVSEIAPAVLGAHNGQHWYRKEYTVYLSDTDDIPDNIKELFIKQVGEKSRASLEKLKTYTMHFEEAFLTADVTLSTPEISPLGEVKVHVDLGAKQCYENQQHTVSLRWLLPEGFSVSGRQSAFIPRKDKHTKNETSLDFVITAGERIAPENRVVLEVTSHGRHTAMYISFVLLG